MRALQEYQLKLTEGKVVVYVRRAGPNYQEGLRIMRELGQFLSVLLVDLYVSWRMIKQQTKKLQRVLVQYIEAGIFECTLGGWMWVVFWVCFFGGDEMLPGLYSIRLWLPLRF